MHRRIKDAGDHYFTMYSFYGEQAEMFHSTNRKLGEQALSSR